MKNETYMILPVKRCLKLFTRLFLVGAFLLFQLSASAQQRALSGTVTGADNEPFAGVSVLVKGTTIGTLTDVTGKFALSVPENAQTLVFSFIGMQTQEIAIGTTNVINVTLSESLVGLDEVIVIGYGTARKADLTGSVTRVQTESFQNAPIKQITEMLTGTVAGFNANQGAGAEGGGSLEVRGPTSLSAETDPLIVLDGVIFNGSLSDINPNDLASIDILKDASSAAVFGSKASNGVILITTTKGTIGKPVVSFTTKIGIQELINDEFRPYPGRKYLDFRRDFFRTRNYPQPDYYWYSPEELPEGVTLQQWRDAANNPQADNTQEWFSRLNLFPIERETVLSGETLDWMDLSFKTGLSQDYDLNMSGGTKDVRYYWSIGYLDNQGIIVGDKFQAIRTRLNLDGDITDWLKVGINSQYTVRDESTVEANLARLEQMPSFSKFWNDDGSVNWYPNDYTIAYNPLIDYYGSDRLRKLNNLFASLYAEIKLPYGFSFRTSFQPRFSHIKDYQFWDTKTLVGASDYQGGYGRRRDDSTVEWMIDNILKWNKEFGIHNFDVTLLQNAEQSLYFRSESENQTFLPTDALIFHGMGFGTLPAVSSSDTKSSGTALMARLNYTLMGKYLLTASVRQDGYSAFGQENPKATFPAVALAWKISDENFFNIDVINRLKLRLSWGVNGNRDIGTYAALSQLASNAYYNGSTTLIGTSASTLSNSGLRWERTQAINIGFDIGLLQDKIDITIDAYDMTTTDLLMTRQLPRITGFNSIIANLGELENRGFELTLNTFNINNQNLTWKSSLVFSMNRNKIVHLFGDIKTFTLLGVEQTGEVPDFTNQWFPGQALDVVWDYNTLGIWQNDEVAAAAEYLQFPGWIKGEDVNGDKVYTDVQDKQFIGYEQPRARIGFRNDFTFLKNLSASVFVRADLGHIGEVTDLATTGHSTFDRRNSWVRPYWTPTDPNNEWPSLGHFTDAFGGGTEFYKPKGFVRVQDVSLAYNLPATMANKIKVNNMRIFVSARNLLTFTKWPAWDPETSWRTPMPRTYTVGLSFSL